MKIYVRFDVLNLDCRCIFIKNKTQCITLYLCVYQPVRGTLLREVTWEFFDLVGKMVVVTDQKSNPADVVLVVEATANLSAYIDVLKKCYIIPSLE